MKTVSQILEVEQNDLQTNLTRLQKKTSKQEAVFPKTWVSALFKKLQARYGHKWVSAIEGIEDAVITEWSEGLAGFTGEQIKYGLDMWDSDWPPSLPEFKKACTGQCKNEFGLDYVPEYYRHESRPERILESDPDKQRRKAAAKKGIAAMRAVMKTG